MTKNEILKKLQKIESLSSKEIYDLYKLVNYNITISRIEGYLKEKGDKEFLDCGSEALGNFLDALIIYKRGSQTKKSSDEQPVTLSNNLIMKKLRVAYNLKESDLYEIFNLGGIEITKSELSSLFRSETHKKFRLCPDSVFELFMDSLGKFLKK